MANMPDSFVGYYNKFKNKIYAYFLYRVGFDVKLAEDLTSEAFLKAFKKYDGFDQEKPFQPWIYTICHNHLVNHYKLAKREVSLDGIEGMAKYTNARLEENFELERIMAIINQMDDTDREVLQLRFVQELSNSEIACLMEKEEGAVRTQISRSLAKLRQLLNNNHE